MPWKETCVMEERIAFVAACLRDEAPMSSLCEAWGISRKTGYKWLQRYQDGGEAGLRDRSRAPREHGRRMAPEVSEMIAALRRDRPHWGPRKLRAVLVMQHPGINWPAASTIGDELRRLGLVQSRRRRPSLTGRTTDAFLPVTAANDLWCIDFKGWFRSADGQRCDPLTVTDAHTRYVLACEIVPTSTHEPVAQVVDGLFRRHGLPRTIRSDNGPPFASNGPGGLSRLSLGWLKAGISVERIAPGKPQQNGRHERFHLTLKQETTSPPAATPEAQQARFDRFRHDFNTHRPHEALGQRPPAALWRPSSRQMPRQPACPVYDAHHMTRKVRGSGEIKWGGQSIFISQTLAGEMVGIAETVDGDWLVRYHTMDLGILDLSRYRLRRFVPPRSGRHRTDISRIVLPM